MQKSAPLLLTLLLATSGFAETFHAADIQVVGPIDYGQSSAAVRYSNPPQYRAFEFNARPGDRVEIWVHRHGAHQGSTAPEAFLTDSDFHSIAGGQAHFSAAIPIGSKPATYYIVFRDAKNAKANFTVELQRPAKR